MVMSDKRGVSGVLVLILGGLLPAGQRQDLADSSTSTAAKVAGYIKELKSKDPMVRKQAALALAELGPKAKSALGRLRDALLDQEEDVKAAAAKALNQILSRDDKSSLQSELARLKSENQLLKKTIFERDRAIQDLQTKNRALLIRAIEAEQAKNKGNQQMKPLLEQLEEATRKLKALEAKTGRKSAPTKNPPAQNVKGLVTAVREDGLVEVSIGTDNGIKVGHTLEVYRLKPKPEYLGTIKILDAQKNKAVGRVLKPHDGARQSSIQKGDDVASRIDRAKW
jgi:hypothetical protein